MDFNAWFEVFLDGGWFTFDARHNARRIVSAASPLLGGVTPATYR
jgi:transglutaminase-like putative cysteine protease